MSEELSDTQQAILGFIEGCQRDGFTPSMREIADAIDFRSVSGVHYQLHELDAKGYIELRKGKHRRVIVR